MMSRAAQAMTRSLPILVLQPYPAMGGKIRSQLSKLSLTQPPIPLQLALEMIPSLWVVVNLRLIVEQDQTLSVLEAAQQQPAVMPLPQAAPKTL